MRTKLATHATASCWLRAPNYTSKLVPVPTALSQANHPWCTCTMPNTTAKPKLLPLPTGLVGHEGLENACADLWRHAKAGVAKAEANEILLAAGLKAGVHKIHHYVFHDHVSWPCRNHRSGMVGSSLPVRPSLGPIPLPDNQKKPPRKYPPQARRPAPSTPAWPASGFRCRACQGDWQRLEPRLDNLLRCATRSREKRIIFLQKVLAFHLGVVTIVYSISPSHSGA
jgi:hypothetical protein